MGACVAIDLMDNSFGEADINPFCFAAEFADVDRDQSQHGTFG
jgi:hypothetical protein